MFEGELYGVPPMPSSGLLRPNVAREEESCKPHSGDGINSKLLPVEASTLFYKFANVFVPNFHEFGVKEVVSTFSRVDIVIDGHILSKSKS